MMTAGSSPTQHKSAQVTTPAAGKRNKAPLIPFRIRATRREREPRLEPELALRFGGSDSDGEEATPRGDATTVRIRDRVIRFEARIKAFAEAEGRVDVAHPIASRDVNPRDSPDDVLLADGEHAARARSERAIE